jgi:hypothetical protein
MENKQYTSVQDQSKKGLSTFILTLSISLIIFSAVYYFMTGGLDRENSTFDYGSGTSGVEENDSEVQGNSSSEEGTVFGKIADADPNSYPRQVLAGADEYVEEEITEEMPVTETTQSDPNLDTGITSVTLGLLSSLVLFVSAMIFVYKNPRKAALTSFEKKTTKGL